jgi:hypothetical protein
MAAIVVTNLGQTRPTVLPGEYRPADGIRSSAVIEREESPLTLLRHDLAAGAALGLAGPAVAHLLYVAAGQITARGEAIETGGSVVVEQAGVASLQAGPEGAILLDFFDRDEARLPSPAGLVHVHDSGEPDRELPPNGNRIALLADSTCPSCDLWLHRIEFPEGHKGSLHAHGEDEIIVVVGGTIQLGTRAEPAGCVLAIDAESPYSFKGGTGGVNFINFRSRDPSHISLSGPRKGSRHPEGPGMRAMPPAQGGWLVANAAIA